MTETVKRQNLQTETNSSVDESINLEDKLKDLQIRYQMLSLKYERLFNLYANNMNYYLNSGFSENHNDN